MESKNIVSVGYNFLQNPELLQDHTMAAHLGAWYWRYMKQSSYGNNNDKADVAWDREAFKETVKKINAGELASKNAAQYKKRSDKFDTVQSAMKDGNAYGNISFLLNSLGLSTTTYGEGNSDKFGIALSKRNPVPVDGARNLFAEQPVNADASSMLFDVLASDFGVDQPEELDMLFLDLPDMQAHMIETQSAYVVADTSSRVGYVGNFGFCTVADDKGSITGGIDITWPFQDLIPKHIMRALDDSGRLGVSVLEPDDETWLTKWKESFSIKVLREPQHGEIKRRGSSEFVGYTPTEGYLGKDRMDILIEGTSPDGRPISARASVFIRVDSRENLRGLLSNDRMMSAYIKQNCPVPKEFWKISTTTPDNPALANVLTAASQALSFADLTGSSVGQATGTGANAQITLDTDAAGHGWYIDQTPYLNDEYLPTSNPNLWIAREGSEAAGKMDLLSVLLHEYGHALGLEHSADAGNFMATTLQPGQRRLPSAEELDLMAGLLGVAREAGTASSVPYDPFSPPGSPLPMTMSLAAFVATRQRHAASAAALTRFAVVANPALTNPQFADGQGWSSTGDVAMGSGAVTLKETATTQTRLNQVFVVGENDRFLSFTLADVALDDVDNAPDDAFEVALIDASTGLSLLGGTGLTRNDAFLNLQADGTEYR